jgi:hypothetical protein
MLAGQQKCAEAPRIFFGVGTGLRKETRETNDETFGSDRQAPSRVSATLRPSSASMAIFGSGNHQHIEDDNRRKAQDHRPDAERPKNVLRGKALLLRESIVLDIHNAPAFLFF